MKKVRSIDLPRTSISDWKLEEPEIADHPTLFIQNILTVKSEYGLDECKTLLRAIINSYLNFRQQRQPLDENRARERKLIINYIKKEDWEWRLELSEITRHYQMYEGRNPHKALIEIQGRVFKFESEIGHRRDFEF